MITLRVTFHGPMRIGTGTAGKGYDEIVDASEPLRSDSIKGVLLAEARLLLPGPDATTDHPLVQAVFGGRAKSPWNFLVDTSQKHAPYPRASIRLEDGRKTTDGSLHVKEESWPDSATVSIEQRAPISLAGLPNGCTVEQALDYHRALLYLAARLAEKTGQRRTRGLGWVSLTLDAACARSAEDDLRLLWTLRGAAS